MVLVFKLLLLLGLCSSISRQSMASRESARRFIYIYKYPSYHSVKVVDYSKEKRSSSSRSIMYYTMLISALVL